MPPASIARFGDARLGLGYNLDNDGAVLVDDDGNAPDDLRAVSGVRFGVNMTGETDSGITFGATIRADNAVGGQGGPDDEGQTEGSVFVSNGGDFGAENGSSLAGNPFAPPTIRYDFDIAGFGASCTFGAWSVGAVYAKILRASDALEALDGQDSYALSARYDLGGGATLNGGVRRTHDLFDAEGNETGAAWVGDFGVAMTFRTGGARPPPALPSRRRRR